MLKIENEVMIKGIKDKLENKVFDREFEGFKGEGFELNNKGYLYIKYSEELKSIEKIYICNENERINERFTEVLESEMRIMYNYYLVEVSYEEFEKNMMEENNELKCLEDFCYENYDNNLKRIDIERYESEELFDNIAIQLYKNERKRSYGIKNGRYWYITKNEKEYKRILKDLKIS